MADEWQIVISVDQFGIPTFISPCNCQIFLRTSTESWFQVDPEACPVRYYTIDPVTGLGSWCPILCPCECEPPYILNEITGLCCLEGICLSQMIGPQFFSYKLATEVYQYIGELPNQFGAPGIYTFTPVVAPGSLGSGMSIQAIVDANEFLTSTSIITPGSGYVDGELFKVPLAHFPASFELIYKIEPPPCPLITYVKTGGFKGLSEQGVYLYDDITLFPKPVTGAVYCGTNSTSPADYTFKDGPFGNANQFLNNDCTGTTTVIQAGQGAVMTPSNILTYAGSEDEIFYFGPQGIYGRTHVGSIWAMDPVLTTECAFATCYNVPGPVENTKTIFLAISACGPLDLYIDNVLYIQLTYQDQSFSGGIVRIFPVTLSGGMLHQIKVKAVSYPFIDNGDKKVFLDIYDMGLLNWPTVNSPGGYATDIDKFVGELMILGLSPATVTDPQDNQVNPYLYWSTEELDYVTVIDPMPPYPFGEPIFMCADESTLAIYCDGDLVCDCYPCEGDPITKNTEINFYVDSSGSMTTAAMALLEFFDTVWKPCLILNVYGTLALFEEKVKFWYMDGSSPHVTTLTIPSLNERAVFALATARNFTRTPDLLVDRVLNLAWADESDVYGYGNNLMTPFDPTAACNVQWIDDITTLRNLLDPSSPPAIPYVINAINFTVHSPTLGTPYPVWANGNLLAGNNGYQMLMQALIINSGNYNPWSPSAWYPAFQLAPSNVSDFYLLLTSNQVNSVPNIMAGQPSYYYESIIHQAFAAINVFIPYC